MECTGWPGSGGSNGVPEAIGDHQSGSARIVVRSCGVVGIDGQQSVLTPIGRSVEQPLETTRRGRPHDGCSEEESHMVVPGDTGVMAWECRPGPARRGRAYVIGRSAPTLSSCAATRRTSAVCTSGHA